MNDLLERIERISVPEPNTGCWLWTGALGRNGYGTTSFDGLKLSAHRASLMAHGREAPSDKVVLHKCDTKSCVNPDHLSIGTHADNAADSVSKHPDRYRNLSKVDLRVRIEERSVPEPNSGCWLWTGTIVPLGYGEMSVGGRRTLAHRASYEAHFGAIPDGALVLHKCSMRCCVNPQHLELGDHVLKMRERTSRPTKSRRPDPIDLKGRLERLSVPEPNTGCHLWCGTVTKSTGYGEVKVNGRKTTAHRASWLAHRGEVPAGLVIMHACDVRLCINPDHLSVGTRRENMLDMARKGRGGFDRLTSTQIRQSTQLAIQTLGQEGLKLRAAKRVANSTPDQRKNTTLKGWQTRRSRS